MFFEKFMCFYTRFIGNPINALYDCILPAVCILCGCATKNTFNKPFNICNLCRYNLPILPHSCQQCAQFLRFAPQHELKCGTCLSQPPDFDLTHALFPYQPPISHLITQLKFQHQLSHAQALGELMRERIQTQWYLHQPLPDLIIPVPLHPQRLRQRGFNQAIEIARPIAKVLGLPIDYHSVKRVKNTLAQSGLPAEDRKHNIAQAFTVSRDYTGINVAVIDDVITTGHTIMECCRMIKRNGAAAIHVWCCARNG